MYDDTYFSDRQIYRMIKVRYKNSKLTISMMKNVSVTLKSLEKYVFFLKTTIPLFMFIAHAVHSSVNVYLNKLCYQFKWIKSTQIKYKNINRFLKKLYYKIVQTKICLLYINNILVFSILDLSIYWYFYDHQIIDGNEHIQNTIQLIGKRNIPKH